MSKLFRFRIGPVFLIALALSALLLWWKHVQDQRPRGPVIVEHQTPASSGVVGAPDPSFVAGQGVALGLSAKQAGQVHGLEEEWGKETGDLQRRLETAGTAAQERLAKAPTGKLTPADIAAETGQVQALSKELAAQRQAYWPRLQAVLTGEQQKRAQEAWAEAHRLRLAPARPASK